MIKPISDEMYAKATKDGLAVIDFRMDFCSPCTAMDHILADVADDQRLNNRVKFLSITVNRHFEVAAALGIQHVPLVLVKRNGQIVNHLAGVHSGRQVTDMLLQYL
jgi:thioredoxin 1